MLDIKQVYSINFPTPIRFGAGVIKELGFYLKGNNLSSPLLVTDSNVAELKFFKEIQKNLEQHGLSTEVYKEMHKNPIKSDVLHGGDMYHKTKRDCIIGIGGGVALDVARAIVLRVNHNN